jgi:zinc-ribbon domain
MAKHCTNCGHELRDGDKFCAECGTPTSGAVVQPQPTRWEYCEIVWAQLGGMNIFNHKALALLWAKAVGPQGTYQAASSDKPIHALMPGAGTFDLGPISDRAGQEACDALVTKLLAAGWEPAGRGAEWFSHKFRRPVWG